MDSTIVGTLAGVLGSVVGASATIATAMVTQKTQGKRELMRAEITKRETLYGEFISECTRLFIDSLSHTLDKPETLLPACSLLNQIRLSASSEVLEEAEQVLKKIMEQYLSPNLSFDELRSLARTGARDPLKEFGEKCRVELRLMRAAI